MLLAEGLLTWLPVHRAQFAGLQSGQHAHDFAHRATHAGVVVLRPAELAFWVDDERAAQGKAFVFHQHAVLARQFAGHVGQQRVLDFAEAIFDPGLVAVFRVNRSAENNGVQRLELVDALAELGDFGWANEGEVERVKEKHRPLTAVIGKRNVFDVVTDYTASGEFWGALANSCNHVIPPIGSKNCRFVVGAQTTGRRASKPRAGEIDHKATRASRPIGQQESGECTYTPRHGTLRSRVETDAHQSQTRVLGTNSGEGVYESPMVLGAIGQRVPTNAANGSLAPKIRSEVKQSKQVVSPDETPLSPLRTQDAAATGLFLQVPGLVSPARTQPTSGAAVDLSTARTTREVLDQLSKLPPEQQRLVALELVQQAVAMSANYGGERTTSFVTQRQALLGHYQKLIAAAPPPRAEDVALAVAAVGSLCETARAGGASYFGSRLDQAMCDPTALQPAFLEFAAQSGRDLRAETIEQTLAQLPARFGPTERAQVHELLSSVSDELFASVGVSAFVGVLNELNPPELRSSAKKAAEAGALGVAESHRQEFVAGWPIAPEGTLTRGSSAARATAWLMDIGLLANKSAQRLKTLSQYQDALGAVTRMLAP